MFSRLEISLQRGLFWLAATAIYWALIFYAWFDTRFQVFLWAQVVAEWVDKRSLTDILSSIKTLEGPVWSKLAEAGPMATPFMIIPAVMAILLFLAPFTIRSDNRRPVRGYFMVPLMIVMCYVSVSLLNVVVAAGMSLGLHLYLHKTLGPDLFMYLVHPVYLAYPLLKNPSGIASQLLYLAYVYSVISTPGRYRSAHDSVVRQDDEAAEAPAKKRSLEEEAGSEDRNSCIMEMDRLCRIMQAKFGQPAFIHSMRSEILDYINRPSVIDRDVQIGIPHYKIVLTEAKNSLRRTLEEEGNKRGERDMLLFIVEELERMDYLPGEDAKAMKKWMTELWEEPPAKTKQDKANE